jgi:hypothetical protein
MAINDFNFQGFSTSNSSNSRVQKSAYRQGLANGNTSTSQNGGEAMLGQAILHSTLANGVASSSVGDYARGMIFSEDDDTRNVHYSWTGMATVNTGSGGPLYPVTESVADGTIVAYSLRAFMRLERVTSSLSASTKVGSYVGMSVKCRASSETDLYSHQTHQYYFTTANAMNSGYNCMLSSRNHFGNDAVYNGTDANIGADGVRLLIGGGFFQDTRYSSGSDGFWVNCSGTYDFNTWHHVRFDCIPALGKDTLNVYTASVSDTVGSETWGLVGTYEVPGGADYYHPWDDANWNKVGYVFHASTSCSGLEQRAHDPMIDRFQFLNKDISGSV